jgi:phage-related protein
VALTIGELVGYIDLDDSGAQRGVDRTEAALAGLQRDADGRLRDMRGRFVAAGAEMGGALGDGIGGGAEEAGRGLAGIGPLLGAAATSTKLLSAGALGAAGALAAVPLAVIGLGAKVLAENEQVKGAFSDLGEHVKGQMQSLAEPLVEPFVGAAGQLRGIFDDLAPQIGKLFEGVAPLVEPLVDGIGALAKGAMPGLVSAVEAAGPVIDALSSGLGAVGDGIGGFFEGVSTGADGAAEGLGGLLGAVGEILPALGGLIGTLAEAGGPVLAAVAKALVPVVTGLADALGPALAALGPPLETFIGALGDALVPIVGEGGPVHAALAETFGLVLEGVSPILPILGQLIAAVLPVFAELLTAVQPLLVTLGEAFAQVMTALEPLVPVIGALLLAALDALMPIIEPLIGLVGKLAEILAAGLAQVITSVVLPILQALVALLQGDFDKAWQLAKTAVLNAAKLIGEAAGKLAEWVGKGISAAVDWIKGLPGRAYNALAPFAGQLAERARSALSSFKTSVVNKANEAISWMRGLPGRISSAIGNLGSLLVDKGRDVVRGLLNGVKSMGGWLRSQLISFAKDMIPGPIADALGIASPSRVMAKDVGRWIPAGLVKGIQGGAGAVDRAMRSLVTTPAVPQLAPAGATVGAYGSPFAPAAGGATVQIEHWHAAEHGGPDDNARALAWLAKARG